MELTFRFAQETDTPLVLDFIKKLAEYEHLLDQVVADEAILSDQLFQKRNAEVLFALEDGKEVGFALFFHNFSTFLGRAGLYLEDLFVLPEHRGKGYGKAIFRRLAAIAREAGLRPHGVVVPGLEHAQHRFLQVLGGGAHERLDRVPSDGGDAGKAGGGVTPLRSGEKPAILFKNNL